MDPILGGALLAGAFDLFGGLIASDEAKGAAEKNEKLQKEFAQHGIKWKVKDAEEAGVHPLYALGASTHMGSPVHVGGGDMGLTNMGQDISRAVQATSTSQERAGQGQLTQLAIQREQLQNSLLGFQVLEARNKVMNPPMTQTVPIVSKTQIPGLQVARMPYGFMVVPSQPLSEPMESDPTIIAAHAAKMRTLNAAELSKIQSELPHPSTMYPGAQGWTWEPATLSFVPYYPGNITSATSITDQMGENLRKGIREKREQARKEGFK